MIEKSGALGSVAAYSESRNTTRTDGSTKHIQRVGAMLHG